MIVKLKKLKDFNLIKKVNFLIKKKIPKNILISLVYHKKNQMINNSYNNYL